jgi:RNA polymerase sigma-70 factor, ECF subfamily
MNSSLKFADGRSAVAPERTALRGRTRVKLRALPKSGLSEPSQTPPRASGPLKPESVTVNDAIRRAQLGDAAAFETIYELNSRRVYALCLRMSGDPVEAEDLTQEAFLQLFRKIHTFRGESAFSSWLHRLTANIVLMRFRKKRPVQVSLDEMTSPDGEKERPALEIGGPDLRLAGVFDRVNLHTAIEQLPEGYRSMFLLHDVQGYEHKEIADMLGCSIGNSKSQLHKARKRLRELLSKVEYYGRFPSQAPASA